MSGPSARVPSSIPRAHSVTEATTSAAFLANSLSCILRFRFAPPFGADPHAAPAGARQARLRAGKPLGHVTGITARVMESHGGHTLPSRHDSFSDPARRRPPAQVAPAPAHEPARPRL